MFLLSGYRVSCHGAFDNVTTVRLFCDYSCCCSDLAQGRDCFLGQLLQGPTWMPLRELDPQWEPYLRKLSSEENPEWSH